MVRAGPSPATSEGGRGIRDAVVIGAGPAGSTMAAVLARGGWDVLLLEQRQSLGHKVCGEFISWEAQEILRSLGLHEGVQAAGPVPLTTAVLTSRSGVAATFRLSGTSWGVSRRSLDTALADAAQAAGATLSMGVRVRRFQRIERGYLVEARSNGEKVEIPCRALIAACGRSSSAELPPQTRTSHANGLIGMKRQYRDVRMPPQVELYFFNGGYAGLAPIEDERVTLGILVRKGLLERAGRNPAGLIERLMGLAPGIGARLAGGEPIHGPALSAAPVDLRRRAEPWDSIPCLGDAAAMIPPLTGDGIASALRSAQLCAPLAHAFLSEEISLLHWEQAYRSRWHATFDGPLALARMLHTALSTRVVSDLLMGVGVLIPPVATKLADLTRSRKGAAPRLVTKSLRSEPKSRRS